VERISVLYKMDGNGWQWMAMDGSSQIMSSAAWAPPQQMMLTPGLRDAVCDLAMKEPDGKPLQEIEKRTGEEEVICRTTVLNILHAEGKELRAAQEKRVVAVTGADPTARFLLPGFAMSEKERRITALLAPNKPTLCVAGDGSKSPIIRGTESKAGKPRQVDEGAVMLQVDEVVVAAQPSTGRSQVLNYSAVITTSEQNIYCSAGNIEWLCRQVAAQLSLLGVHRGERQLIMMGDGAKWVRYWFEDLAIENKMLIICWYHLLVPFEG
jgi:hypothetical protein